MKDHEIERIDFQETEAMRKLMHEKLRLQSHERLQNRKVERKIVQFKAKQRSSLPRDNVYQSIKSLDQKSPQVLKLLA